MFLKLDMLLITLFF